METGGAETTGESGAPAPAEARITLLVRPACHLCDLAREALDRVAQVSGVAWVERDVTEDEELERDFGDRVPVVLLDGREHDYFRVDEDRLLRELSRRM